MTGGLFALNFFSPAFIDQLKRARKTATIRLGDKSRKYQRGQIVWITVGYQHSPREKIFAAVIDEVDVKRVRELSPRDIEHDNPEFRRLEEALWNPLDEAPERLAYKGEREMAVAALSRAEQRR